MVKSLPIHRFKTLKKGCEKMANRNANRNAPTSQLANLEGTGYASETLPKLMEISSLAESGAPKTAEELQDRLIRFFEICAINDIRPGIEKLALCLGIDRRTFWAWCDSGKKDPRFTELCRQARQLVVSMLEDATQTNKMNVGACCFLLKNWAQYRDEVAIETKVIEEKPTISLADLPKLDEISKRTSETDEIQELPDLPWIDTID